MNHADSTFLLSVVGGGVGMLAILAAIAELRARRAKRMASKRGPQFFRGLSD